jgi:hypothetical protein
MKRVHFFTTIALIVFTTFNFSAFTQTRAAVMAQTKTKKISGIARYEKPDAQYTLAIDDRRNAGRKQTRRN